GKGILSRGWGGDWLRDHFGEAGLYLFPGFHRFWGKPFPDPCGENWQDHGFGDEERRPDHWPQRQWWSTNSRRRRILGWIRRYFLSKRSRFGGRTSDIGHYGSLCGRGGLFSGNHRLCVHGRKYLLYVRHRAQCRQNRDP